MKTPAKDNVPAGVSYLFSSLCVADIWLID
jgi:hypothetical protein